MTVKLLLMFEFKVLCKNYITSQREYIIDSLNTWFPCRNIVCFHKSYKVECDKLFLSYIELGHWLCSHFQLETPLNFQADNSKTIQHRAMNLASLDSLGSCDSIYVYFKAIKLAEV